MIDRFGKDIPIHPAKEKGFFETHVNVAVSDQFYGWMFALGTDVEIIGPEDIREAFFKEMKAIVDKYSGAEGELRCEDE